MSALLADSDDCGRALLRLTSRGHAVLAELQRIADVLPPAFTGDGSEARRFAPVLPDFSVWKTEGAVERLACTPELIELDEESRELHYDAALRLFRLLASIRKYAADLERFLGDLDAGMYINRSLESLLRDPDGVQLVSEAIAMLGTMLLLLDERIASASRERGLVAFYRFTVGTNEAADDFSDVCRLFKATGRPGNSDFAKRGPGYPESFFARFPLPPEAVKMTIGQLQTGDVYNQARHYPLPEHRSHSLAAQAGLLYVVLFFAVQTLESDAVAMREIVNRHFGDAWVVAYALGFTADLLAMWAPYPAAREALAACITPRAVQQLRDQHCERLHATRQQLAEYLSEGALTEEFVMGKTSALLSCLRQANTTIRWLLLQPTTSDAGIQALFDTSAAFKERVLEVLVNTALLEERVRGFLGPMVGRREADWAEMKQSAWQKMDDLALYFSGDHALRRNVRNDELEQWFRGLQQRIEELSYGTEEENLTLGRKIAQLLRALEEVEHFHEISQQPQILHFLSDTRVLLQRMVRVVNLKEEVLSAITTIADLSYAWTALGAYQQLMHALLGRSPGSVKGLRALFLKLASILETPLRRVRQAKNEAHVAEYYSARLVAFMRSVLQEIPRLIFGLLAKISEQRSARLPEPLPSRISLEDFQAYAQASEEARSYVALQTQQIALLMRGIRETDVAVLGIQRVEPRVVLVEGLRNELARQIESLLATLVFPVSGRTPSKADLETPVAEVARRSEALRRAFEHVQDYVGVSALEMWHVQFGRVVRFLLHMEQHVLLRRRLPHAASSPYHNPDCPILFPDATSSRIGAGEPGGSFISRTALMLLALSEPKGAVGGLRSDWRSAASGELLLDGLTFDWLQHALGVPGTAALSRALGLRCAGLLRKALFKIPAELSFELQQLLSEAAAMARAGGADAVRGLRSASQRTSSFFGPLVEVLASIGQHQLLRRRIHRSLALQARLAAPLVTEALGALDTAELAEDVSAEAALQDEAPEEPDLPTVWDFVGAGQSSPDEALKNFHCCLAGAAELPGFTDPLRQLFATVPIGSLPLGFDALLALALLSPCGIPSSPPSASSGAAPGGSVRRSRHRRGDAAEATVLEPARPADAKAALLTGVATLLQQLPRTYKDSVLELLGAYVVGICVDPAGAEGATAGSFAEFLGDLLELLGLPREQLAQHVPQGLLELLPPER